MADLSFESWSGEFAMDSRDNWPAWLGYLGVPEAAWEAATSAPDFHKYLVTPEAFVMEHRIPAQNTHLHFRAAFSDRWLKCPYPQPTASLWKEDGHAAGTGKPGQWRNKWLQKARKWQTDIINFAGKGNTVVMVREMLPSGSAFKIEMRVLNPDTEELVCGPCTVTFKRISDCVPSEPPSLVKIEPAHEGATEMKVTLKRGGGFYAGCACSFFRGIDAKPALGDKEAQDAKAPVEHLRISGAGEAVGVAIAAATKVTSEGLGVITKLQTAYPGMDGSHRGCAQILIDLQRKQA